LSARYLLQSESNRFEKLQRDVQETAFAFAAIELLETVAAMQAVKNHIEYIDREGSLDLETDEGERLNGDDAAKRLIEDWDLDLDVHRRQATVAVTERRKPSRLVHNVVIGELVGFRFRSRRSDRCVGQRHVGNSIRDK